MSASAIELLPKINESQQLVDESQQLVDESQQLVDKCWQNSESISLEKLVEKLLAHFKNEQLRKDSEIFLKISLRVILGSDKENFIKTDFFNLVENFGPFDNGFLQRIFDLVEKTYFFGKLGTDEAVSLLTNSDSQFNSALIRMSNTKNCFTMSYRDPNDPQNTIHKRFERDPNGKIKVIGLNGRIISMHDTFDDLLKGKTYPPDSNKISIMLKFYREVEKGSPMEGLALSEIHKLELKAEADKRQVFI
jgi:hypothetical protein